MTILFLLVAFPVLLATATFAAEVAFGLWRGTRKSATAGAAPRAVVVVPAHDEAATLNGVLRELQQSIDGQAEILVVADNCTDETAAIARALGIHTIERLDPDRRGKGFALDFARTHLLDRAPEVVVILDADCRIDRDGLRLLVATCAKAQRPCQSAYLMRTGEGSGPMVQISNFAFMLKNLVRQRGLARLAGSVHLTGSGMALPWPLFAMAALATDNIVEDVKLGLELTEQGAGPLLIDKATVWSEPSNADGTLVQRERWEGGNMALARHMAPRLLSAAIRSGRPRLLIRALDLFVPPLTILILANVLVGILLAVATWLMSATAWTVVAWAVTNLAAGLAVAAAWAVYGRSFLRPRTLVAIPGYLLWKLPLYARIRRNGAKQWLRAGR